MSADNYTRITKKNGKYVLSYGVASNDWSKELGTFDKLEDAIKEAPSTEYGLSFNLDDDPTPNNNGEV